jgi:hypothetical protein
MDVSGANFPIIFMFEEYIQTDIKPVTIRGPDLFFKPEDDDYIFP